MLASAGAGGNLATADEEVATLRHRGPEHTGHDQRCGAIILSTCVTHSGGSSLPERGNVDYYKTLQVIPGAEPEVIAAAYRALAKKYHPDRSNAADAMARMAQLNVAFQALRSRTSGRLTEIDSEPVRSARTLTQEHANPSASLEETLRIVHRKVTAARQQVIDELTQDGFARDVATGLAMQAFKEVGGGQSNGEQRRDQKAVTIDLNSTYDEILRTVSKRAEALRNGLADELAHEGLQKAIAIELVDAAFESIRRRREGKNHQRFSNEHVDLSASLDAAVNVVEKKLKVALHMLVEEITQDGVPQKTAEQLVKEAVERMDWPGGH